MSGCHNGAYNLFGSYTQGLPACGNQKNCLKQSSGSPASTELRDWERERESGNVGSSHTGGNSKSKQFTLCSEQR